MPAESRQVKLQSFIRHFPFTLVMLLGLGIGALVTNTYFDQIALHWLNRTGFAPNDLWYGELERMFTSAWVTVGGKAFWEAILMIAFAVGLSEWIYGSWRAAATFWGIHLLVLIIVSLVISLSLHQLRAFGIEASETARDVGPSAGYFACLGLVSARLRGPWNLISGVGLCIVFIAVLLMPAPAGESAQIKFSADLAHLLAFPLGWLSAKIGLPSKKEGRL